MLSGERHIDHIKFVDGFHAQIGKTDHLRAFDVLAEQRPGAARHMSQHDFLFFVHGERNTRSRQ